MHPSSRQLSVEERKRRQREGKVINGQSGLDSPTPVAQVDLIGLPGRLNDK